MPYKKKAKHLLRWILAKMHSTIIQRVVDASSPRFLKIFDYPDIRSQYPVAKPLSPDLWGVTSGTDGHMFVENCDCVELERRYGTPLILVLKNKLEQNYLDFYDGFRKWYPNIVIGYSYKTNPLPGSLSLLHKLGASAEVVSPIELQLALSLGVAPEKIIYNGPGKTTDGLSLAVSKNIELINIDGMREIEIIDKLAGFYGHRQNVGVRVVTSVGWRTKFGFHIETGDAFKAFERIKIFKNIIPCGIHFHLSTGVGNVQAFLQAIKEVLDFAALIKKELDITIRYFDFGGGFNTTPTVRYYSARENRLFAKNFPVQEAKLKPVVPIHIYGKSIAKLITTYYSIREGNLPTLIFEPGRAITESSQILLLKVLDKKPTRNGITDIILDGGRNVAAPLGWECHAVFNASNINAPAKEFYALYGPLCTPYDSILQIKKLSPLSRGDILAVMDAGAYFVSMQSNFCSFSKPAAVLLDKGQHRFIRDRQTYETMFAHDFDFLDGPVSINELASYSGRSQI
jgi:diaminopimelate decarboxylase